MTLEKDVVNSRRTRLQQQVNEMKPLQLRRLFANFVVEMSEDHLTFWEDRLQFADSGALSEDIEGRKTWAYSSATSSIDHGFPAQELKEPPSFLKQAQPRNGCESPGLIHTDPAGCEDWYKDDYFENLCSPGVDDYSENHEGIYRNDASCILRVDEPPYASACEGTNLQGEEKALLLRGRRRRKLQQRPIKSDRMQASQRHSKHSADSSDSVGPVACAPSFQGQPFQDELKRTREFADELKGTRTIVGKKRAIDVCGSLLIPPQLLSNTSHSDGSSIIGRVGAEALDMMSTCPGGIPPWCDSSELDSDFGNQCLWEPKPAKCQNVLDDGPWVPRQKWLAALQALRVKEFSMSQLHQQISFERSQDSHAFAASVLRNETHDAIMAGLVGASGGSNVSRASSSNNWEDHFRALQAKCNAAANELRKDERIASMVIDDHRRWWNDQKHDTLLFYKGLQERSVEDIKCLNNRAKSEYEELTGDLPQVVLDSFENRRRQAEEQRQIRAKLLQVHHDRLRLQHRIAFSLFQDGAPVGPIAPFKDPHTMFREPQDTWGTAGENGSCAGLSACPSMVASCDGSFGNYRDEMSETVFDLAEEDSTLQEEDVEGSEQDRSDTTVSTKASSSEGHPGPEEEEEEDSTSDYNES